MTANTVKLISDIGFTPASSQDIRSGMLGFVTVTFADLLVLDGATLRVTESGKHALSFPSRTDAHGRRHPYFRPRDDRARIVIENAIFAALGIKRDVTS